MFGGGLMQLIAYGAQDVYLTGCSYSTHIQLNDVLRYKRKYENFEIICDNKFEKELNKESLYFLNKEKAKEKSEIEDVKDLEEGEQIVFKNIGKSTIITVTTKKIIFRAFDIEERTAKENENVIVDEKRIFLNRACNKNSGSCSFCDSKNPFLGTNSKSKSGFTLYSKSLKVYKEYFLILCWGTEKTDAGFKRKAWRQNKSLSQLKASIMPFCCW